MKTVEQAVRALLDDQTSDGTLSPGAKVPTERELVLTLGASRSAVRRALDVLEVEGIITRHVGRGTFLAEPARHTPEAPPDTSPMQIMQSRLMIEPPVASLASQVATQGDIDLIHAHLDAGGRSDTFEDFERWDAKLHRSIAHAVHNELLMAMFDVMNTARALPVWGSLKRRTSTPERRSSYHHEHVAVVQALTDRDPEGAAAAMRAHLEHVSDNLLGRH